jgi:replicative DNA helicase
MAKLQKQQQTFVIDLARVPPHSEDLEKYTLGVIILVKGAILKVNGILKEDTFYYDYHSIIYEAILNLFSKDSPIDTLLVIEELKKMGNLNGETISESYITSLTRGVVNDASLEMWVRKLEEFAIARRNIQIHLNAVNDLYKNEEDVFEICDRTDTLLFQSKGAIDSHKNISMARIGDDFIERVDRAMNKKGITGCPTGLQSLDAIIGGWQPQTVNTIGALPNTGKTAVIIDFMYEAALLGSPTGLVSMEMVDTEIYSRMISKHIWRSRQLKIDYSKINRGLITPQEFLLVKDAKRELDKLPIYIDDQPAINTMQLKSKAMKLINDKGLEAMYVDYVQLLDKVQAGFGFTNTAEAISQNMRDLKKTAKAINIPIIPLSQVDRNVGKKPGSMAGKATMQDLKGSGGLEENSDVIILLDRPELYDPDNWEEKGMMHLVIAKHKNGEKGEIVEQFDLAVNSFIEKTFKEQEAQYTQRPGYPPLPQPPQQQAKPKYEPRFNYRSTEFDDKDDDQPPF